MQPTYIKPSKAGFSGAVKYANGNTTTITVSGCVGVTGTDLNEQANSALKDMKEALEEAGASMDDVIKTNAYLVNIDSEKIGAVGLAVHNAFKHLPKDQRAASTWVGVTGLVEEGLGVEIEAEAIIPTTARSSL